MDPTPDQTRIVQRISLPAAEFDALLARLDEPARVLPRLAKLMAEARPVVQRPDDLGLDFAESFMGEPANYQQVYNTPFSETHPCEVPQCMLSQEEHHRIAYGMINELRDLRAKVRNFENGPKQ